MNREIKPWPVEGPGDLETFLNHPSLTPGQRRRLAAFREVESGVSDRIEELCSSGEIELADIAVLVVTERAHGIFFDDREAPGTRVILGDRRRIHMLLGAVVAEGADAEPAALDAYSDLLEPAAARSVRVLIVDDDAVTILSYGTFVTVPLTTRPGLIGRA